MEFTTNGQIIGTFIVLDSGRLSQLRGTIEREPTCRTYQENWGRADDVDALRKINYVPWLQHDHLWIFISLSSRG